jgi:hypothetical protein
MTRRFAQCPLLAESGPMLRLISDDLNVRFREKRISKSSLPGSVCTN